MVCKIKYKKNLDIRLAEVRYLIHSLNLLLKN